MGSLSSTENFHAKRKRMISELVKGKKSAIQLQTLLHKPVYDEHNYVLALQILRSFTETLSELSSCTASTESTQNAAVDCGGSASSAESKKKKKPAAGVKDRRGCYKRRKTSDSWESISSTTEDGCAWRKYGQKTILNSVYPRCYFRCTHKYDQGCKATKQVQRTNDQNPIQYQTTYFNHHTCKTLIRAPHLMVDSDPVEANLISFQANIIPSKQDLHSPNPMMIISAVKQEDTQSEALSEEEAKSTLHHQDPWQEIIGLELMESKPVWDPIMSSYQEEVASGFHSCESTSFHGLDMEVNQLGNLQYFDEIY